MNCYYENNYEPSLYVPDAEESKKKRVQQSKPIVIIGKQSELIYAEKGLKFVGIHKNLTPIKGQWFNDKNEPITKDRESFYEYTEYPMCYWHRNDGHKLYGNMEYGLLNGYGILYANNVIEYIGNFKDGIFHGYGKFYKNEKLLFEGYFKFFGLNGEGQEYFPNGKIKYEGGFFCGEYHGKGTEYDQNGKMIRQGTFKEGKFIE